MENNKPVIDQTLFDLKLNEAKFYADQGLYDEADKIYFGLINELKQLPKTKSSDIQIRQLESIRKEYHIETKKEKVIAKFYPSDEERVSNHSQLKDIILKDEDIEIMDDAKLALLDDFSLVCENRCKVNDLNNDYVQENSDYIQENTDNNVVNFVNEMIIKAYQRDASDIHIEPSFNSSYARIRFRIDGICQTYTEIPDNFALRVIFKIKIMAKIDITLRAKPLDGKIRFKSEQTGVIYFKVVTVPTIGSREDMVLQFLQNSEPIALQSIGFLDYNIKPFVQMINKSSGLILVAGISGSGKKTTLHSALKIINTPEKKIWSAENPISIKQKGIRQAEVQSKIGLDYPLLLKSFIRADPDVIMLAEMMDYETASLAIKSSLAGHLLILASINAGSIEDTVRKILEMGVNPIHFADSLVCILFQRLVRRLCEKCKIQSKDNSNMIIGEFGEDPLGLLEQINKDNIVLYDSNPDGCVECGHTGYKGRVAIHELFINSGTTKSLIKETTFIETIKDSSTDVSKITKDAFSKIDDAVKKLKDSAIKHGMYTLKQDEILKVIAGITDIAEIKRSSDKNLSLSSSKST